MRGTGAMVKLCQEPYHRCERVGKLKYPMALGCQFGGCVAG